MVEFYSGLHPCAASSTTASRSVLTKHITAFECISV